MIDWDRVFELREEVGAEEFDDVVELFIEEVDAVVHRLRSAPDPSSYEADLHFLKGSALNLGFAELGRLCQAGESAAAAGDAASVGLAPILDCYVQSRKVFLNRVGSGLAA